MGNVEDKAMRCEEVREQLSAWLDGELSAAEQEATRAHLETCSSCRAELEALRRTVRAVRELPHLSAPADLRENVMASLEHHEAKAARPALERLRIYWPAAAAVLIAAIIYLLTPGERRTPMRHNLGPVALKTSADEQESGEPASTRMRELYPSAAPSAPGLVDAEQAFAGKSGDGALHATANRHGIGKLDRSAALVEKSVADKLVSPHVAPTSEEAAARSARANRRAEEAGAPYEAKIAMEKAEKDLAGGAVARLAPTAATAAETDADKPLTAAKGAVPHAQQVFEAKGPHRGASPQAEEILVVSAYPRADVARLMAISAANAWCAAEEPVVAPQVQQQPSQVQRLSPPPQTEALQRSVQAQAAPVARVVVKLRAVEVPLLKEALLRANLIEPSELQRKAAETAPTAEAAHTGARRELSRGQETIEQRRAKEILSPSQPVAVQAPSPSQSIQDSGTRGEPVHSVTVLFFQAPAAEGRAAEQRPAE